MEIDDLANSVPCIDCGGMILRSVFDRNKGRCPRCAERKSNAEMQNPTTEGILDLNDTKTSYAVEVNSTNGIPIVFSGTEKLVMARLRDAVLSGKINGNAMAVVKEKVSEGKWSSWKMGVCCLSPQLRFLYSPLRSQFLKMIQLGVFIGISYETLFQSWLLFQHYHDLGPVMLFWLPPLIFGGFIVDDLFGGTILRNIFLAVFVTIAMGAGATMLQHYNSIIGTLSPSLCALIISAALGATLGITAIGGLAGIWILLQHQRLSIAQGNMCESTLTYKALTAILLVMFAGFLFCYIKWAHLWPMTVEIEMREYIMDSLPR